MNHALILRPMVALILLGMAALVCLFARRLRSDAQRLSLCRE